ncbi:unnamed protein product [Brassica oleracea var. botrytis]
MPLKLIMRNYLKYHKEINENHAAIPRFPIKCAYQAGEDSGAIARKKHLQQFLQLGKDHQPADSRQLAGRLLKNSLDAGIKKDDLVREWLAVEPDVALKSQIKELLLETLGSSLLEARHTSAQAIAMDGSLPHLKQSTLVTLGYVCAETFQHLKQDEVDSVLAVILQGMNQSENTAERAFSEKAEIRQAAFECLVSIALKYHKLSEEYKERLGNPDNGDSSSPQFIKKAIPHLIPMLLGKLRKPEEGKDHSGDVLRISMTARKCLCLVSRTGGDEIVHIAIPFILENILEIGSWRHREAAISAFESILDGSTINKLSPHVTSLLRFLLPAIKDENKDTQSQIEEFQQHHRVTGLDNTISASQQPKVIEKLTVSKKKSLIELMPLVRGHLNSNGELEKEMWKIFLLEEEKSQVILMKFLSAKDFKLCQGQSVVDHPTSIFIYGHDREVHAVVYDNVYNDFPKKIFDDRAELDRTVSSFLKT